MWRDFLSPQFVRFLVTGGLAALVNFSVGFLLARLLPYNLDLVVGHVSGMVAAFILFELFVFGESSHEKPKSMGLFVMVNLLALLQTYLIGSALEEWLFPEIGFELHPETVARIIAIGFPVLTSFLGHKYFTFRQE
jgi:putative flippase GtrA